MENKKKMGYPIYDYMSKEMGLSGVALRVYALICSFTRAGGDCHGSLKYIAERTQSSVASVHRALTFLVEKGYVTKEKLSKNRPSIYIALFDPQVQNGPANDKSLDHNDNVTLSKCEGDIITVINNNKDNNKGDNKYNYLPTYGSSAKEKTQVVSCLGREGLVRMTFHQYACLLRAVEVVPTIRYIRKLERQILRYPERKYPNHYKTIITWARQDFRLDAADEMLVREEE